MAWRIDEQVVRGEIDNRTRGRVVGKIWFVGRAEPVELELSGDCWRDLAGRRLEFVNPAPKPGTPEGNFAARQVGSAGDITASRKVKVLDFPLEDLHLYYKTGREMPWHWGSSLYLEWFSERNGRVVIETASFELKIVGEPTWEMTEAEEETQRRANGEAMGGFMQQLGANAGADESERTFAGEDEAAEDELRPQTEAEAEALYERSELLNDRIQARLDREGDEADLERIIEEEMARLNDGGSSDDGEAVWEEIDDGLAGTAFSTEEVMDAAHLDVRPGRKHPLSERAQKLARRLLHEPAQRGWLGESDSEEHPLAEFVSTVLKAGGKLAGALNGREWPPALGRCAAIVVRLKRAEGYLNDARVAHADCVSQKLADATWLVEAQGEVDAILREVEALIAELRGRLERGTD